MKNELENLRFNLTPKIQDLIIEMLIMYMNTMTRMMK